MHDIEYFAHVLVVLFDVLVVQKYFSRLLNMNDTNDSITCEWLQINFDLNS